MNDYQTILLVAGAAAMYPLGMLVGWALNKILKRLFRLDQPNAVKRFHIWKI
jgi:hypothetical protein